MNIDPAFATIVVALIGAIGAYAAVHAKRQADKASESAKKAESLFSGYVQLNKEQRSYFEFRKAEWERERAELLERIEELEKANTELESVVNNLSMELSKHGQDIRKIIDKVKGATEFPNPMGVEGQKGDTGAQGERGERGPKGTPGR